MFDVVNNKRNSLDVDKLDYINRDILALNLSMGIHDYKSLLKAARVIDN